MSSEATPQVCTFQDENCRVRVTIQKGKAAEPGQTAEQDQASIEITMLADESNQLTGKFSLVNTTDGFNGEGNADQGAFVQVTIIGDQGVAHVASGPLGLTVRGFVETE